MSVTFVIDGGGNFAETMEKNRKAQDNLYRETQKWLNAIKTPQEKHNENVRKLGELNEKGKISAQEYGRAVELSYTRMNAALDKNIILAEEVNDEHGKTKGILDSQVQSLTKMAVGWASISAAIGNASAAVAAYNQAVDRSRDDKMQAYESIGNLQQLTKGDPQEFAKLMASARDYRLRAGLGEGKSGEAYQTINELANTGLLDKSGLFAEMRGSRMISDVGSVVQGASAIQFNAPGAGDITNVLATSMAAAGTSSKNLEPIMQYMGKVASAAQPLGLGFNESAALMSVGATATGSAERGSEMMTSLLNEIVAKGSYTPGMSVDQLVAANKQTAFGSVASQGYRTLSGDKGREAMRTALSDIASAQANPERYILDAATSAERSDTPEGRFMAAQRQKERADAALAMANEERAVAKIGTETGVARGRVQASRTGGIGVAAAEVAGYTSSLVPVGEYWGSAAVSGAAVGANASAAAAIGAAAPAPVVQALKAVANAISSQPKAPPLPSVSP